MDEIDRAQERDEFFRNLALKNKGLGIEEEGLGQTLVPNPQPLFCEGCGFPIPEARRKAVPGCMRCIDCQTEFERIHAHGRIA